MVDTGAEPNLIKVSALKPDTPINQHDTLSIRGVTHEKVGTIGTTYFTLYGTPLRFHVVQDVFPINADGILGSTFLQNSATTRVVRKIRFPRSCSREERCYAESGDTVV
ncbi:hypothetical protein WH47_00819 [Habropoda laboriosa]|uniref:Peptidase A2 domain-containing protein n=1 Tax=Habropoda laboriosa TaxID=597456 RepID=A0A0L7QK41_9HYME|nr:hypothetical protein WH47_00819 [Habropoda laboriosa]